MAETPSAPPAAGPGPALDPRTYLKALGIAAVIGIPVALLAVLFVAVEEALTDLLWEDLPEQWGWSDPQWWWVLAVPTVGGVLVALVLKLPGHGGHAPADGFSAAPTHPRHIASVLMASLITLSCGAVLGPEAPLIALGSAFGLGIALLLHWEKTESALLAVTGSFASIASIFGNPLNTTFFMLEAGAAQGAALIPALLPGLLAAGIGYIIYTGVADWTGLPDVVLAVPGLPTYTTVEWPHLLIAVVIGAVTAVVAAAVHESSKVLHRRTSAVPALLVVPLAGFLVGGCAVVYHQLTGEPVDEILFSGQAAIPEAVAIASGGTLFLLIVFKAIAYALSLGGGFRGGPVFPALFLGVCVGTGLSVLTGMSVTAGVGAGIAAGMASMLRFPLSGVLFALLITGSAGFEATPIFIVASVTGYIVDLGLERFRTGTAAPGAT